MKQLLGVTLILAALAMMVTLRLANIDMTETRLLLEFWPQWILVLLLVVVGANLAK